MSHTRCSSYCFIDLMANLFLVDLKYAIIGQEIDISFRGQGCRFRILQAKDINANLLRNQGTIIHTVRNTKLVIAEVASLEDERTSAKSKVSYSSIGGLEEQIRIVREMVETPLQNPQLFRKYGMSKLTVTPEYSSSLSIC